MLAFSRVKHVSRILRRRAAPGRLSCRKESLLVEVFFFFLTFFPLLWPLFDV